ncbi:hypothetical protein, partial [uncultured Allobaculum sp.]|uniref:hypothetical protein n=1 Tax=uncultured Allobaculum sp. TaxID=1187017 RepID=UPI00259B9FCC
NYPKEAVEKIPVFYLTLTPHPVRFVFSKETGMKKEPIAHGLFFAADFFLAQLDDSTHDPLPEINRIMTGNAKCAAACVNYDGSVVYVEFDRRAVAGTKPIGLCDRLVEDFRKSHGRFKGIVLDGTVFFSEFIEFLLGFAENLIRPFKFSIAHHAEGFYHFRPEVSAVGIELVKFHSSIVFHGGCAPFFYFSQMSKFSSGFTC